MTNLSNGSKTKRVNLIVDKIIEKKKYCKRFGIMKYFPYLCSVENKTMVIMEKGHKAIILPTNEQLYANSIANLKGYFKEHRNNKRLS